MKIEDQVVSVELTHEMKEQGAEQDSLWYWTWAEWNDETIWVLMAHDRIVDVKREKFSAYTVAELGDILPARIKIDYGNWTYLHITKRENTKEWVIDYNYLLNIVEIREKKEADARAKMWIYLKKKGLL